MASAQICLGVGVPMMVVGGLLALALAPESGDLAGTVEFVGSLIGVLGAVFFISGLFHARQPVMH